MSSSCVKTLVPFFSVTGPVVSFFIPPFNTDLRSAILGVLVLTCLTGSVLILISGSDFSMGSGTEEKSSSGSSAKFFGSSASGSASCVRGATRSLFFLLPENSPQLPAGRVQALPAHAPSSSMQALSAAVGFCWLCN